MKIMNLFLIVLILGVVVFFGISYGFGFENIGSVLQNANFSYLGLAFVFQFLSVGMVSLRWNVAIKHAKIRISPLKVFMITLAGVAFCNITPSFRVGGEPIRAHFLNKHAKVKTRQSFATIVTERIFDTVAFVILSLVVLALAIVYWKLPVWINFMLFLAVMISIGAAVLLTYISINKKIGQKFIAWLLRHFSGILKRLKGKRYKKRMTEGVLEYNENVKVLLSKKEVWFYGILCSILTWVFDLLRVYFVFLALGFNVNPILIGAMLIIVALVGMIPLLPGGLAVVESTMIIIYGSAGISLAVAGTQTIIDRLISFWSLTFIGFIIAYYLGLKAYEKQKKKKK